MQNIFATKNLVSQCSEMLNLFSLCHKKKFFFNSGSFSTKKLWANNVFKVSLKIETIFKKKQPTTSNAQQKQHPSCQQPVFSTLKRKILKSKKNERKMYVNVGQKSTIKAKRLIYLTSSEKWLHSHSNKWSKRSSTYLAS